MVEEDTDRNEREAGEDADGERGGPLEIRYERHERVRRLLDTIRFCLEEFSLASDESAGKPPGMYVAVVSGHSIAAFADPIRNERWPVEQCSEVLGDLDAFCAAASEVARSRDGAVVVSVDGVIQAQMVRFRDFPRAQAGEASPYADWMGTRHMSALDTSRRESVVATVTLSQETGRVTVFEDGSYDSVEPETFATRWIDTTGGDQ
ncbi:DNA integrity scanning protein DisA nucleotide-binding domain protein [Natronobiforma cellulositropha]|uniref:DNA integrity scanning protein DisA nucleotide-binding domain protein n=1 Tax=Natronobiforma cellulositropha TaxID=1679076 RepID=UPI0021D5FDAC|nr:DNA integrity scanning protein DisA nucleotide-binding domain protein [Natronobiforma cellulositropha]